jgi:hypothetical protein
MLNVIYAECREEAHCTHYHYAERRYAECRYAECRGTILNVIMLRVVASGIYLSFYVIHLIRSEVFQI